MLHRQVMRYFSKWRHYPVSRRMMGLVGVFVFTWTFALLHLSYQPETRRSDLLRADILELSEQYVRALAKENGDIVDGPYAGRFTAYDLKRTLAVLLENSLGRIDRLEDQVQQILNGSLKLPVNSTVSIRRNTTRNGSVEAKPVLGAVELIRGIGEKCLLTDQEKIIYPHCLGKVEWMRHMWKYDACYAAHGADGSDCSFIMYLSEVEQFCPQRPWRGHTHSSVQNKIDNAITRTDLDGIKQLLVDPNDRHGYAFMRMRITRMWHEWVKAITNLERNQDMEKRPRKRVLVHLGFLTKQSGWKFAELQFKGGPLGELVQWSDVITSLYMLGHNVTITSETEQLDSILAQFPAASPCQDRKTLPIDLLYTDIAGLRQFHKKVGHGYGKFSCLLRILDSFGTEPAYNHRAYAQLHKIRTIWGGQDLIPQQFFTMFPHTPDNSFMGFAVERYLDKENGTKAIERKRQALVYGKNDYMWKGHSEYLDIVKSHNIEIHATVSKDEKLSHVPDYVINHGILNGPELHLLLKQSLIFIGFGFPYEGPAPLEAIANGAVFINPKFKPPHNNENNKFFKGKPTSRKVTSQHPYAEQFIGPPYVYTIDINNVEELTATIRTILTQKQIKPYLPYEFTEEGMLQRLNAYIEHQNFCHFQQYQVTWPPASSVTSELVEPGVSCSEHCAQKNLICEPSYFHSLNSRKQLLAHKAPCSTYTSSADIIFPALQINTSCCTTLSDELLFSCAGSNKNVQRLCPCRNFITGQTALCRECIGFKNQSRLAS